MSPSFTLHPELMDELVVEVAHGDEVVEIGRPLVLPLPDVVGLQESRHVAAGERATTSVTMQYLTPEPGRWLAARPVDPDRLALAVLGDHLEAAVADQAPGDLRLHDRAAFDEAGG